MQKFFNINNVRFKPMPPLRALKLQGGGGVAKVGALLPKGLVGPNQEALARGIANLEQHIANVKAHGVPAVVAINAFDDDLPQELNYVRERALAAGAVGAAVSTHWAEGDGGQRQRAVVAACDAAAYRLSRTQLPGKGRKTTARHQGPAEL
jgi:formate--tetrahydrofolate ligase